MRREPAAARTTRTQPKHKQANLFQFKNFGHAQHKKRVKRVGGRRWRQVWDSEELVGATAICIIAVVMEEQNCAPLSLCRSPVSLRLPLEDDQLMPWHAPRTLHSKWIRTLSSVDREELKKKIGKKKRRNMKTSQREANRRLRCYWNLRWALAEGRSARLWIYRSVKTFIDCIS